MAKVKICGLKSIRDIFFVNKYLPEYVGFIFAKSKRQVTEDEAELLISKLDARIKSVGVFVNKDISSILSIVEKCRLNGVQIHSDEGPEYFECLRNELVSSLKSVGQIEIWKAVRVKDETSLENIKNYNADAFVLDTYTEGQYGGAGKKFDWNLAVEARKSVKIILAGGLNRYNVREAINILQPFMVDVSSGVETEDVKDGIKIRDFINIARCYD